MVCCKKLDPYIRSPQSKNIEIFGPPGTIMFEIIGPPQKHCILLQSLPKLRV